MSPEIIPKSDVLPAPLGPTIPTEAPGSNWKVISSATTTWPNFLETPSSCSSDTDDALGVRRLEGARERNVLVQRVVHHVRRPRPLLVANGRFRTGLPLDAHRLDDAYAGRGSGLRGEVQRTRHADVVDGLDRVRDGLAIVGIFHLLQRLNDDLEQRVRRAHGLDPLLARRLLVVRRELARGHSRQRGLIGTCL